MLTKTISDYLTLFQEASTHGDVKSTLKLFDAMKKEFHDNPPSVSEVIQELERIARTNELGGATFVLIAARSNFSSDYTPILCQLLNNESAYGIHELIIDLLEEVGDERAIPTLSKALNYRWTYDEWLLVPRKSLQALAAIGSSEAIAIIHEATQSPEELISTEASFLIEGLQN